MYLTDTASRNQLHSDRVASLHRAALPPSTVEPPRRPRIRQSLGRSLVALGVWLARDPQLDVPFAPGRSVT